MSNQLKLKHKFKYNFYWNIGYPHLYMYKIEKNTAIIVDIVVSVNKQDLHS